MLGPAGGKSWRPARSAIAGVISLPRGAAEAFDRAGEIDALAFHHQRDHVAAILAHRAHPFVGIALEPRRGFRLRIIRADRARPDILTGAALAAQRHPIAGDRGNRVAIFQRV
jgi:hypothetical protein